MNPSVIAIIIVAAMWLAAIFLSLKTTIIKDISDSPNKPYSFSRTQLLWWTLLIASCFILGFAYNENLPAINNTALALLGIGLGTTTLARVVDNNQVNQSSTNNIVRHQNQASQGFFTDLLSDDTGISVHRFQSFVFNVIFGIAYITDFFNLNYILPTYDNQQLLLLGISSGAYVALKMNENGISGGTQQAANQASPAVPPTVQPNYTPPANTFQPTPSVPPVQPTTPTDPTTPPSN
ncbi:MAG: hypothetical protein F9K23_06575 [Bacteroidetes bacterium]|nr:MAG: hypothetical protein F9K23_06575 [Bacteroidota bacterium]